VQLDRHLAQRLDDHQRPRVRLEVREEAPDVAPGLRQSRGGEQRLAPLPRGDRVDGPEQQLRVGRAEHGQHVIE
jgi:hypothetical protein